MGKIADIRMNWEKRQIIVEKEESICVIPEYFVALLRKYCELVL
jgi:hypothetical protein